MQHAITHLREAQTIRAIMQLFLGGQQLGIRHPLQRLTELGDIGILVSEEHHLILFGGQRLKINRHFALASVDDDPAT